MDKMRFSRNISVFIGVFIGALLPWPFMGTKAYFMIVDSIFGPLPSFLVSR